MISNSSSTYFYYLFGFVGNKEIFNLQKHNFNSIENFQKEATLEKHLDTQIHAFLKTTGVSCFQTQNEIIMCFYLEGKHNDTYDNTKYIISAYNDNLTEISNISFNFICKHDNNIYYKCIHLKDEIGIFSYFYNISNKLYPVLLFKEYNNNSISNYTISEIVLNKIEFNNNLLLNDIIKLTNKKISFLSTSLKRDKLYIVIISLFEEFKYKIRYYKIEIFEMYNYKIYMDIRAFNYNNFISFGFSFCNNKYCEEKKQVYNSGLIIFNYPNSTDRRLFLNPNITENSTKIILNISLEDGIIIENNIFGYIFDEILINNLFNCDNFTLKSSNSNDIITSNYSLSKNEIIKLEFEYNNNQTFHCSIQYNYIVTEPNLDIFDIYPEYLDGYNETNERFFEIEKEKYIGKLSYYNITNEEEIAPDYTEIIGNIEIIKRNLKENKEKIVEIIPDIINSIEIGKNYEYSGDDFTMIIKPTNITIQNTTNVDFLSCEKILRNYYKIPDSRIITFLQLEIENKNNKSLINQVGYQVYDDNKNILDLSLCNNSNIQIFYLIKSDSSINISFVSSFKDLNIDLFNINDAFFNDICKPYAESENDVILKDRVQDYYQNYSLCEKGCTYKNNKIEDMTIVCDCKVKNNLTTNITDIDFMIYEKIYKSSVLEILKCYNLVFSLKDKLNNIGFWIFLILISLHIPLLFMYFWEGIKPIKEYLVKEMVKNGYIKKKEAHVLMIQKNVEKDNKYNNEIINNNDKKIRKKRYFLSDKNNNINFINNKDSSSLNRIKNIKTEIINGINNKTKKKIKNKNRKIKSKIKNTSLLPTDSILSKEIKMKELKETNNQKNNFLNLNLIKINLNNGKSHISTDTNYILNIYTYDEAKKYDLRSKCLIFYIFLLTKQAICYAFLFRSPLELFPLRFCLLLFIISSDLALNAIFYFDDKISAKYKYTKSLLLFAFSKNITVILLSTFVGFILLTFFIKLSNSTNDIRNVFRKEEEKMKKEKSYIVSEKRKEEMKNEIENILKKYKIKVIIFIVIELLFMLFFWYYVIVFCHVYSSTQLSWLWDSFLSMLSRLIIDLLFSYLFAQLYIIGIKTDFYCIYKVALFFYSFGS